MPRLRNQERHEAILDVAIQLVREQGVAAASLQDIADRAGIKKGSLANYFRSKAELAELIQDRFTKIADQVLQEIIQRDDINAQEKLRELLYLHAEHCAMRVSSPVFVSFMQLWAGGSPTTRDPRPILRSLRHPSARVHQGRRIWLRRRENGRARNGRYDDPHSVLV